MQAYRFRLLSEEQDDFLRDIEIKPGQTYKQFHEIILQSVGIEGNELASFFICDQQWNKKKEITLIDMGLRPTENDFDEEEDKVANLVMPLLIMEDVKIKEMIDEPHQRILYEYNFLSPVTLYIELSKIIDADPKKTYPVCVKKEGALSSKSVSEQFTYLDDLDEIAILGELDDMIKEGNLEEQIDENYSTEPEW